MRTLSEPVNTRWSPDQLARIDAARGLVSRAVWIRNAVENQLARENAKPTPEPQETHA